MKFSTLFVTCAWSLSVLLSSNVWAAGFSCDKAHTSIEKTICGHNALNSADEKLGNIYRNVMKSFSEEEQVLLLNHQRRWLRLRNKQCQTDVSCLLELTELRIMELLARKNTYFQINKNVAYKPTQQLEKTECGHAKSFIQLIFCQDKELSELREKVERSLRKISKAVSNQGLQDMMNDQIHEIIYPSSMCSVSNEIPRHAQLQENKLRELKECIKDEFQKRIEFGFGRCEIDEKNTIEDLLEKGIHYSNKIPKGLVVEHKMEAREITWEAHLATSYNYPVENDPRTRSSGRGANTPVLSLCTVTTPDGVEWLAERYSSDHSFTYIREQDTQDTH